jgi:hypothetical protein
VRTSAMPSRWRRDPAELAEPGVAVTKPPVGRDTARLSPGRFAVEK